MLKEDYENYEYLKNIIALSSFVLLGSHSGFVFYFYSKGENLFSSLLSISIIVLVLSSILFSVFLSNHYLIWPILFFGVSVFLEKKIQVDKQFYLAILYKPLLSLLLVSTIFLSVQKTPSSLYVYNVLAFCYPVALIIWLCLIKFFAPVTFKFILDINFTNIKSDFYHYIKMVKVGVVENAATILLMLHLFTDRYMLNNYYQSDLASYSLAFNFSQLVFVGINSLAYIQNVRIGEDIINIKISKIKGILLRAFFLFLLLFICVVIVSYCYELMFDGFDDLTLYTIVLAFFIGIFYTFNVIGIIPLLKGKQKVVTFLMVIIFLTNLFLSFLFYHLSIPAIFNIGKTVLMLSFFGGFIVFYSLKLIQSKTSD